MAYPATELYWHPIPGIKLAQIDMSADGSSMWGIDGQGFAHHRHGFRDGGNTKWTNVSDGVLLQHVSVSSDGGHIWGVSAGGRPFYRDPAAAGWKPIDRSPRLQHVSVSSGGAYIWGVGNGGGMAHYRNGVNGTWTSVRAPNLAHIDVSDDGEHVWATTAAGAVYYRHGIKGLWIHTSAPDYNVGGDGDGRVHPDALPSNPKLQRVAVSSDGEHVWGFGVGGVYHRGGANGRWRHMGEKRFQGLGVTSNGAYVWGVGADGKAVYTLAEECLEAIEEAEEEE